jgi:predicted dehydrogenase
MNVKIGLVGCGSWGRHILRDLKSLGCYTEVVAVSEASKANAREHRADRVLDDINDFSPEIRGFVVATPTVTHTACLKELLPKARPIFVEKPLCDDIDEARRLPVEAETLVFSMHKWRYHPGIIEMRRIAESEEFGAIRGLRTRRVQWGQPHEDTDAIWILGPHDLAIATHIFDCVPKPLSASKDPFGLAGSGLTAELVDEKSGALITVEVSESHPTACREVVLGCDNAAVVLSDEDYGSLIVRPWPNGFPDKRIIEVRKLTDSMPLFAELQAFVSYVNGGQPPLTPFKQELEIIQAITDLREMAGLPPVRKTAAV